MCNFYFILHTCVQCALYMTERERDVSRCATYTLYDMHVYKMVCILFITE